MKEPGDELLESTKIVPSSFMTGYSSGNGYFDFVDGKDGYWYGFASGGNSSGNATVRWIKIKKSDYSFSEGTWTLESVQIQNMGNRSGYGGSPYKETKIVALNGYVYFMHYNRTGLYKVNMSNPADITFIKFGFTSNFNGGDNYGYRYM